ncbi:MAG: NAD(P)/FAD-dependent oxidoreductase [Sphingopyxis sp.]|nr:NAD(P)/FAD-dependent oxidoreductase [Sphingopyxis sp.]
MQIVPEVADRVKELVVFARSKQWAAPFPQFRKAVPDGVRYLTALVPLYRDWFEQRLAWMFNDRLYRTLFRDPDWPHQDRSINQTNDRHREFYTHYIREELGDRQDLLPDLLPDYPPYLKRMLMDNGWFRTMTKPNVRLIPDRLAKVDNGTLVAASGATAEADILVLATGFTASALLSSYEVVGRDGRVLREYWDGDNVDAFLGTLVAGFPNMFILTGPHTGSGHGGSMMRTMENQIHYALSIIEQMEGRGADSVEVRQDVYDDYRQEVDAMHDKLLWSHKGSDNWYRNSRGRVTTITPWRNDKYWRMTRRADEGHLLFDAANDAGG